jgi:hypothetical protein
MRSQWMFTMALATLFPLGAIAAPDDVGACRRRLMETFHKNVDSKDMDSLVKNPINQLLSNASPGVRRLYADFYDSSFEGPMLYQKLELEGVLDRNFAGYAELEGDLRDPELVKEAWQVGQRLLEMNPLTEAEKKLIAYLKAKGLKNSVRKEFSLKYSKARQIEESEYKLMEIASGTMGAVPPAEYELDQLIVAAHPRRIASERKPTTIEGVRQWLGAIGDHLNVGYKANAEHPENWRARNNAVADLSYPDTWDNVTSWEKIAKDDPSEVVRATAAQRAKQARAKLSR